jgi:hypothetical protein
MKLSRSYMQENVIAVGILPFVIKAQGQVSRIAANWNNHAHSVSLGIQILAREHTIVEPFCWCEVSSPPGHLRRSCGFDLRSFILILTSRVELIAQRQPAPSKVASSLRDVAEPAIIGITPRTSFRC